jgi:hypothetical protein
MNGLNKMNKAAQREAISADIENFLSSKSNVVTLVRARKAPKHLRNIFIPSHPITKDEHYPVGNYKSIPLAA